MKGVDFEFLQIASLSFYTKNIHNMTFYLQRYSGKIKIKVPACPVI